MKLRVGVVGFGVIGARRAAVAVENVMSASFAGIQCRLMCVHPHLAEDVVFAEETFGSSGRRLFQLWMVLGLIASCSGCVGVVS